MMKNQEDETLIMLFS